MSHEVSQFSLHLPHRHNIFFWPNQIDEEDGLPYWLKFCQLLKIPSLLTYEILTDKVAAALQDAKHTACFQLNQKNPNVYQYHYIDIPIHYTRNDHQKRWT